MKKDIEDREINIVDMFWAICLRWRQILVAVIIFAVLAGSFSYLKSAKAVEKVSLEDLEFELDEVSKGRVNAYLDYL